MNIRLNNIVMLVSPPLEGAIVKIVQNFTEEIECVILYHDPLLDGDRRILPKKDLLYTKLDKCKFAHDFTKIGYIIHDEGKYLKILLDQYTGKKKKFDLPIVLTCHKDSIIMI